MFGINCVICTSEDEYTVRLCGCINACSSYNIHVKALSFSKAEEMAKYPEDSIFVVSVEVYKILQEIKFAGERIIILCDEKDSRFYENSVKMYRAVDEIINNIIVISNRNMWIKDDEKNLIVDREIYGFMSLSGSDYKSLCALDFARNMAEEKSTLYINLEPFSGISFKMPQKENIEDLLFLFESESATFEDVVRESMINEGKLTTFNPVNKPEYISEVGSERWIEFISKLMDLTGCECVVVDFSSLICNIEPIYSFCDYIVNVYKNNPAGKARMEEFFSYLESMGMGEYRRRFLQMDPGSVFDNCEIMDTNDERRNFISTVQTNWKK